MLRSVVELPEFVRRAKILSLSEEEKAEIIVELARNPLSGDALGSGIRKWRYAPTGKGKRGGYRVVFFYVDQQNKPIYLVTIFSKDEKANLSARELKEIRKLGKLIMET